MKKVLLSLFYGRRNCLGAHGCCRGHLFLSEEKVEIEDQFGPVLWTVGRGWGRLLISPSLGGRLGPGCGKHVSAPQRWAGSQATEAALKCELRGAKSPHPACQPPWWGHEFTTAALTPHSSSPQGLVGQRPRLC